MTAAQYSGQTSPLPKGKVCGTDLLLWHFTCESRTPTSSQALLAMGKAQPFPKLWTWSPLASRETQALGLDRHGTSASGTPGDGSQPQSKACPYVQRETVRTPSLGMARPQLVHPPERGPRTAKFAVNRGPSHHRATEQWTQIVS